MIETAIAMGFRDDHIGCPCNGSPHVMLMNSDNAMYTLTVWVRRNVWRLATKGYTIGTGNKDNLKQKLQEYGLF